ncbi:MAG: hypothetical protein FWG03_03730 [Clostridiales bacterium]|nr:hypothetical protein [Clostridiales bacterium]
MEQASRFPVLASIWPSCNGGKVEARLAPQILEELEGFCLDIGKQKGLFLSDVRTGDDIYSFIKSNGGVFHFDGRIKRNTGFDQDGLFVVDRETGQEYFRSKHFTQKPLPEEKALRLDGKPYTIQPALLTDIGSGKECRVESLIGGYEEYSELAVVARHLKEDDFYSIEPLRNLLKASIETGNPVFWT